ncbi:MAG: type II toxin-antitoxin system RelE/ParE family toxin [Melioribacteraceae bacterium]|nr:type II toxin-antitoxin system RelE/ParE family toxin [Melioribacteraceae bacterium]MCF8353908.1 type II toxin-antitoxin system RelE/ParE family toxin [Melioribacteraceae bacterium]MCF8392665.1 type II toxin-antitoxin system RelE/ParE family toxin [Melioribacteraceae bacterium]MCF8417686.1 type II toxin-antitoxin system RelE/ParE family toxin [Melioribacteraceae bacterium]
MRINYKSKKLEKSLTIPKDIQKTYGQLAKKIKQRMDEFTASKNLAVLGKLPGPDCHQLEGNRKEQFSVSISGNWRIIFVPNHIPVPVKEDGGVDWELVSNIKILEVIDYHKK